MVRNTRSRLFRPVQGPHTVHGAIYRRAFGEPCRDKTVVGEGFAIINGKFKTTSGSFNAVNDDYHDDNSWMHPDMARCVESGRELEGRGKQLH